MVGLPSACTCRVRAWVNVVLCERFKLWNRTKVVRAPMETLIVIPVHFHQRFSKLILRLVIWIQPLPATYLASGYRYNSAM
jgi:hypothetical protein